MAGEARRQRIRELLHRAGASNLDVAAVDAAFAHESAVREGLAPVSNERLEFLGDAVLGFVVARSLVARYPDASEGELALRKASLVADSALATTAERLGFDGLILFGTGLARQPATRRRSALADAFEAFLAVLHRECGLDVAAAFVAREHVAPHEALGLEIDDPKTVLQEWTQRRFKSVPLYEDSHDGPAHDRTFTARVVVDVDIAVVGSGPSKKAAQRAAAAAALDALATRYDDVTPRIFSRPSDAARPLLPAPVAARPRRRKTVATTARPAVKRRTHS